MSFRLERAFLGRGSSLRANLAFRTVLRLGPTSSVFCRRLGLVVPSAGFFSPSGRLADFVV
jgi:hypothetical protein